MTSIHELFPKCRKLAYDSRQQLGQVQRGLASASELYLVLEELQRQLDVMEQLALQEAPQSREVWKRKIAELRQEAAALQQQGRAAEYQKVGGIGAYGGGGGGYGGSNYGREREELLLRRRNRNRGDESDVQNLASETQSLDQSNLMVNDLLSHGEASLAELQEQRNRLRGITRVVFDIGTTLGFSQSTMRIIERRDITDAYLVVAGMIVTLLVIYFVWF